jgi:Secretion system C-terminal sorting domain
MRIVILFLIISFGIFLEALSQNFTPSDGTYNSPFQTVSVSDADLAGGFALKITFAYSWAVGSRIDLAEILTNGNQSLVKISFERGQMILTKSVKYGTIIHSYELKSWNTSILDFGLQGKEVDLEIGFSPSSVKTFIFSSPGYDSPPYSNAACELGFMGTGKDSGSALNELIGSNTSFNLKVYQNKSGESVTGGTLKFSFDPNNAINIKSCYTLNSNFDNNNVANARSGLTKDNKRNCEGTNGSQARIANNAAAEEALFAEEVRKADDLDEISVYPIPAKKSITLEFPQMWLGTEVQLSVVDMSGKIVLKGYRFSPSGKDDVDVSPLAPGVYLLLTENNARRDVKRIVIE